jgi:hypothetical protein
MGRSLPDAGRGCEEMSAGAGAGRGDGQKSGAFAWFMSARSIT